MKDESSDPTSPAPRETQAPLACRVCGGYGFVAQKQFIDDGYGEVDSCPACTTAAPPAGWQPIETAPMKTHDRVLLWWTTRGACSGYFDTDVDRNICGWRGDQDLVIPRDQHRCTHWMPLPAPPAEDGYHKGIYKSRCCSTLKANPYTFDSCPTCGRNLGWERAIAPAPPAEKEKP